MTPAAFQHYVADIAERAALPLERVLLGGDHLGPNCWRSEPSAVALQRSEQLVADYVSAGFRKIHLDCSMSCADDPATLSDAVMAARAARLCRASEAAWRASGGEPPLYVIGTEVPTPGGAAEDLETLAVTTPSAVTVTLEAHRKAFLEAGHRRGLGTGGRAGGAARRGVRSPQGDRLRARESPRAVLAHRT